jgi:glycosyltransferase involved in cell wall biosynthesis
MARLPASLDARLTVAGVCWDGGRELRERIAALGVVDRVELRDGFVSNEEAALLFTAADASLLPYRSATQSGVVQLSFAYGVPVIATAVGGLVHAVSDGVDGILCPPEDVDALVGAITRMAADRRVLAAGVQRAAQRTSFDRYGQMLVEACAALAPRRAAPSPPGAFARAAGAEQPA